MTVVQGLKGPNLDLILHSPGGSGVAAEFFVKYLRSKFENIRIFIPQGAMSAATMIACSADEIVMGKHSYLGPIDPQMLLPTPSGISAVPAFAILEQFEKARIECKEDPSNLAIWMPILGQYSPGLIMECETAIKLSKDLAEQFLKNYMFKGDDDSDTKSQQISEFLSNHNEFKSHGRHIDRNQAKSIGLKITELEDDQELQDLSLSVFHSATHTLNGTIAVKITENQNGIAMVKLLQMMTVPIALKKDETPN